MSADGCCMMRIFKFTLNAKKQLTENQQFEIFGTNVCRFNDFTIAVINDFF